MFNPTEEQIYANKLVAEGKNVLIEAGAGAAKSTSLRFFAQQNPDKNFLVLCFNKANADESNEHPDRPQNAYYSTLHSIAYKEIVDKQYREKLSSYLSYTDIDVVELGYWFNQIPATKDGKWDKLQAINEITTTVQDYCRSNSKNIYEFALTNITNKYTCEYTITTTETGIVKRMELPQLSYGQMSELAEIIQKHWRKLVDKENPAKITHDVYLKIFHLRDMPINSCYDAESRRYVPVDVICLDEAQDSNPVTLGILRANSSKQTIVVGDSMQQLYAWRGAVDAINTVKKQGDYATAKLTNSFRFTQSIADTANCVLEEARSNLRITGKAEPKADLKDIAILCRTNSSCFSLINALFEKGYSVYSPIDTKDLFSKLYHIDAASKDAPIKYPNKELKHITNNNTLQEACAISVELDALRKLVYAVAGKHNTLYRGIEAIKNCLVDKGLADVTVTTIHKSKGLEWDQVLIYPDMLKPYVIQHKMKAGVSYEDIIAEFLGNSEYLCMLYVAITRAKYLTMLPNLYKDMLLENTPRYGRIACDFENFFNTAIANFYAISDGGIISGTTNSILEVIVDNINKTMYPSDAPIEDIEGI